MGKILKLHKNPINWWYNPSQTHISINLMKKFLTWMYADQITSRSQATTQIVSHLHMLMLVNKLETTKHHWDFIPEPLLYDHWFVSTFLQSFMFFVTTVLVLDNNGCISTLLKAFLCIIASELTLNENSCLSHLLVVSILWQTKKKSFRCYFCQTHADIYKFWKIVIKSKDGFQLLAKYNFYKFIHLCLLRRNSWEFSRVFFLQKSRRLLK